MSRTRRALVALLAALSLAVSGVAVTSTTGAVNAAPRACCA
jgi:hypothetical protein